MTISVKSLLYGQTLINKKIPAPESFRDAGTFIFMTKGNNDKKEAVEKVQLSYRESNILNCLRTNTNKKGCQILFRQPLFHFP